MYERGIIYRQNHTGALVLPKSALNAIHFYDGVSWQTVTPENDQITSDKRSLGVPDQICPSDSGNLRFSLQGQMLQSLQQPAFSSRSHYVFQDSPSTVAFLVLTYKDSYRDFVPLQLQHAQNRITVAFQPKTKAYKAMFSDVSIVTLRKINEVFTSYLF